jgi:ketosteroid isomerase-like protein
MTTETTQATAEAEIRKSIEDWMGAVRAKDVNSLMSHYLADILTFDLAPPLQYQGADAYRRNWEEWFPTFHGPIGYEIRDLSITASGDVAFCHSLNHISGTRTSGERTDVWVRATACFRRMNGRWLVAHEHISVPMYMDGSDKAALDLRP